MGSRPPLLTPPYPQHQEMLGPHQGSDLVPELVLVLPQQDGDKAVEVSGESSITEGFPASGLEKQKGWTMGARLAWKPVPRGISTVWSFCLLEGLVSGQG